MAGEIQESLTGENKSASQEAPIQIEYSVFSRNEKRWLVFIAAFAAMFSPMSSFVFYPAITSIADDLGVTVAMVNLAITTYMIVSGITPAILGNMADNMGRRPIYMLALSIYLVANIGLGAQSNYAALLVLRMIQSAGISGKYVQIVVEVQFMTRSVSRDDIAWLWRYFRHR